MRPLVTRHLLGNLDQEFLVLSKNLFNMGHMLVVLERFRCLIILGVDFIPRQKAVLIRSKIDKAGLKPGFYMFDNTFIDVAALLFRCGGFDVITVQKALFNKGNPVLLRFYRVDKHLCSHLYLYSFLPFR